MSQPKKRIGDWIDLTASDDESPATPKRSQSTGPASQSLFRSPRQLQLTSLQAPETSTENESEPVEVVDLTNEDDDAHWGLSSIGLIETDIVGIDQYKGEATVGERVGIRRDSTNVRDQMAIEIWNLRGERIGQVPPAIAFRLAPYIDSGDVMIEGSIAGPMGRYRCPIQIQILATVEPTAREILKRKMFPENVPFDRRAETPQASTSSGSDHQNLPIPMISPGKLPAMNPFSIGWTQPDPNPVLDRSTLMTASELITPREQRNMAEKWGASEEALAKLPMAEQPKMLQLTLLPYQRQGLAWMLSQESPELPPLGSSETVQLWKRVSKSRNVWHNIATQFYIKELPVLAKGGLLADDMGLGKTIQVISVILEGKRDGPTLILAPVSVMSNWAEQIERHIKKENALNVLIYHGSSRKTMTQHDFESYDVVITTYGKLIAEHHPRGYDEPPGVPRKDGLFSLIWERVVLDEGHQIRNAKTKSSIAACDLMARSRWVLSGTPIVNTVKDLFAMLKFLRIEGGLQFPDIFNSILTRPLKDGNTNASLILRSVMRAVCLRRKKEMAFIDLRLPPIQEFVHRIPFRSDEKKKYEAFQMEAQGLLRRVRENNEKGADIYRHMFEILLRLRQMCCHWKLCGTRVSDLLALIEDKEVVSLDKETISALQVLLQVRIDAQEECGICMDALHDPVITTCKHTFCMECIERTITLQHKCPACRTELEGPKNLVQAAAEVVTDDVDLDTDTKSSKTEALMKILASSLKDPQSKVIIFSQWTSFLDVIQRQVVEANIQFTRIDGKMKVDARDAALASFGSNKQTKVLLASLAVCSVGLNLVAADTVILADSWWAPAIEDQAVDRVHRLGQTRPCTVWRLIMDDSIEERVLEIQAEKRDLNAKAFQEETTRGATRAKESRLGDIMRLLG